MTHILRLAATTVATAGMLALAGCGSNEDEVSARGESMESVAKKVDASNIRPRAGQWESSVKIDRLEMKGLPPEAAAAMQQQMGATQSFKTCLTKEQAEKPSADFFNGAKNPNCTYQKFDMAGGKVDAVMSCKEGGQTQNMTMTGTYSEDAYDMKLTAEGQAQAGMPMSMAMSVSSRRIGECPG